MKKPLTGGAVFLLCIFVGIIFGQVALGILAGLFLGALVSSRKTSATEESSNS
jgi:anaerobic C4-dicarboxylate transporter